MPSLDPADFLSLVVEPKINQPHNSFAHVIGQIMYGIGEGMIKRGIVIAPAIMLMQGGAALMVVNQYLASKGIDLPSPQDVVAIFVDAVNAIRDALDMVGNFLLAVGQAIYDALVWFADAVMEYGSVLLGLLIIAVALALFFLPVYAQIKLWGIFLSFSEGKVDKAVAQSQDLASTIGGVAGKLRRR